MLTCRFLIFSFLLLMVASFSVAQDEPVDTLEEMVAKIFATRRITRADQSVLMAMFAGNNISANDKMLINQIYDALNQGRLRVVE